jgi:uridylate kinase
VKNERVVISLSGTLVAPGGVDSWYVGQFVELVKDMGVPVVVVVGGGAVAREYQRACRENIKLSEKELDRIGIAATRLNAELVRAAFGAAAHPVVVTDPTKPLPRKQIVVAAGWKPGFSSDYVAVEFARRTKSNILVNLTYIDTVYTQDPRLHPDAIPLYTLSWPEYFELIGVWQPGMHAPFDPVAAKAAHRNKLAVVIINGHKFPNLEAFLNGHKFTGTLIS